MARAHALHILVKTKEEAEDLKKKLGWRRQVRRFSAQTFTLPFG